MNTRTIAFLCFFTTFIYSCQKKQGVQVASYTFGPNPSYSGSHPSSNQMYATLRLMRVNGVTRLITNLQGISQGDEYSVHIHQKNVAEPFGYSGNPVIDLGKFTSSNNYQTAESDTLNLDLFVKHFEGYFIVHDPFDVRNDTTTLLVYGKITPFQ